MAHPRSTSCYRGFAGKVAPKGDLYLDVVRPQGIEVRSLLKMTMGELIAVKKVRHQKNKSKMVYQFRPLVFYFYSWELQLHDTIHVAVASLSRIVFGTSAEVSGFLRSTGKATKISLQNRFIFLGFHSHKLRFTSSFWLKNSNFDSFTFVWGWPQNAGFLSLFAINTKRSKEVVKLQWFLTIKLVRIASAKIGSC